jgi:GH15 family glucan-1,4-alpha-glucosidase
MLLPAMMDVFKRRNLKSLFMGAENATNTPAANAMADNVIFCWRSRHNVASDHNEASQTPEDTPEWSQSGYLMLYVDRASSMERPAKSLYKIPIMVGKYDDRRECLKAPRTKSELNGSFHRINWLDADPEDLEHIKTVRRFQGLE